jgi:hypothetical protein
MLVQEPRGGSSLKIIAAVLGVLLCADLITRVPFGSLLAGPEPAVSSTTGAAMETSASAANPTRPAARRPELAAAKEPQPAPAPASQIPPSVQQPNAAASPAQQSASQDSEPKTAEGLPCEQQTWPYIDSRCKDANNEAPPPANREVRVIGKDSTAPATVVTPLPADAPATQAQAPREGSKIGTAAPATARSMPSTQQTMAPSASAMKEADHDPKAVDTTSASPGTAGIDLPRPAPENIRKSVAPESSRKTASAPGWSTSSVQESTRAAERSGRRATKTTNIREDASKPQKVTSKQNPGAEPSGAEETPWRREETSWGREEKPWKREETSRGREETSWKREETSRGRKAESRRTGVTESRAYQLPSGRRIIVFRQSNGEVGIAPAGDSSSFFFGR